MANPVDTSTKSTQDRVLDGVELAVKGAWGLASGTVNAAHKIGGFAKSAWNHMPDWRGWKATAENAAGTLANKASNAANWASDHAPDAVKDRAGVITAVGVGVLAAGAAVFAAPAVVGAGVVGLVAAAGSKVAGASNNTALAIGAASVAAPFLLPIGGAVTALTAAATGTLAGSATYMTQNPNQMSVVPIPEREPIVLHTPGDAPAVPLDQSLHAINNKLVTFDQAHPIGMNAARRVEAPAVDLLKRGLMDREQATTNENFDKFIDNASTFASVYFILVNRLNIGGEPRQIEDVDSTGHMRLITTSEDPNPERTNNLIMEIVQKAAQRPDGTKPNLWEACMECLERHGKQLTTIQWIRAKFWYFLAHTIGIASNSLKKVANSILTEARKGVTNGNAAPAILRILEVTSTFLDRYNGAAKAYANAGQPPAFLPIKGDLDFYRHEMISQLGDDLLFQKVQAELKPGEDLSKKMMHALCKEFTVTLIDEYFPEIPFFEGLKKFKFLGIRFGIFFDLMDWTFGSLINWIGKKVIKAYAPDAIQSIVQTGIDKAMPGEYSFKIAIANALTDQIEDLKEALKDEIPTKPLRFEENRKLKTTITKLLNSVQLNTCETPEALRQKFIEMNELERTQAEIERIKNRKKQELTITATEEALLSNQSEAQKLHDQMNQVALDGAQLLIDHYTKKPEAVEKLFGKLFERCNDPFEGAVVRTEAEFTAAVDRLKDTMSDLLKDQIKETVLKKVHGEDPEKIRMILEGKLLANGQLYPGLIKEEKDKGEQCFQVLQGLSNDMLNRVRADLGEDRVENDAAIAVAMGNYNRLDKSNNHMLKELDNYVKIIREFAQYVKSLNIDLYKEELSVVEIGFNQTFSPIYQDTVPLVDLALELQGLQKSYDKNQDFAAHFAAIEAEAVANGRDHIPFLREELARLDEIDQRFKNHESDRGNNVTVFHTHIVDLEAVSVELAERKQLLQKLELLGEPNRLSSRILAHPKSFVDRIRKTVPLEDRAQLMSSIERLQNKNQQDPKPDLTQDHAQITEQLTAITLKYRTQVQEKVREKTDKLNDIRLKAAERKIDLEQKRDNGRHILKDKLQELKTKTKALKDKIAAAQLKPIHFPFYPLLRDHSLLGGWLAPLQNGALNRLDQDIARPIQVQVEKLAIDGYHFITSPEIAKASARLALGEFIKLHRKP